MKAIVEENRSLLRFYERAARMVGWVLLCGGTVWLIIFILCVLGVDAAADRQWPGTTRNLTYAGSTFLVSFAVPGLLALLIGQLIKYSLDAEGKPGWLLCHGARVLYAFGLVLIGQAVLRIAGWEPAVATDPDQAGLLFVGPSLVPLLAKILICVGLGQLLGRILPIIDESRTLV
jgi:hypothetical protein